ncbi:hypothetical protein ACWC3Y_11210 [Streptomyces sp. NPDC001296]
MNTKRVNTKRVNAAAELIRRSMGNGRQTPAGWAMDLESAQLLQSPETAAELEQLRAQVAELLAERHTTNEALDDAVKALRADRDRIAELEAEKKRVAAHAEHLATCLVARSEELMAAEDPCRPCGCPKRFDRHADGCPTLAAEPADGITRRNVPLQALREDALAEDVAPQVQKLRNLLAGQRAALEDPHDSPLHHTYRISHDLPEMGGTR